jgi:hypothetical protein
MVVSFGKRGSSSLLYFSINFMSHIIASLETLGGKPLVVSTYAGSDQTEKLTGTCTCVQLSLGLRDDQTVQLDKIQAKRLVDTINKVFNP